MGRWTLSSFLTSIAGSVKYGQQSKCPGTKAATLLKYFQEVESSRGSGEVSFYINYCLMDDFKRWSQEELRLVDYENEMIRAS